MVSWKVDSVKVCPRRPRRFYVAIAAGIVCHCEMRLFIVNFGGLNDHPRKV
jgi:hypothetical protein